MKDDCHLHGRSAEESILLNSYFASLSLNADSPASMILVWGDSGVGKSKIAESLRPHVLEDDGYFIRGKFDQLSCCGDMALSSGSHTNSSHVPYGGIASAFVEYCNLLEERGCEAWREVAEKLKREIGMEDGRVLFEAIPALERIFIRNENSRGESSSSRHENWSQFHSDTIHAQNRNNNIGYFLLEEEEKKQSDRSLESRHGYTEIRLHRLNHLLKKFIHAISSVGDPIILLVDDVQWADLSSLELLRNLIQGATSPFTFIFTYRPNEPSHPFLQMIKELEHTRITKTEIHLRNLGEKSVYDLVESTLNIDPKKARGMMPRTLEEMKLDNDERVEKCTSLKTLTHEVCNITNGNPFFIKQQIIYWIGQGLLALDENDQWVWDIDKIRESNVLGDVVSMILEKIKMLPVSTQRALTICACIGSKVDLDLLGLLFREMHFPNDDARGIEEVEEDAISVALEEMLLVYNEDRTKVAFVHDSIQSAAYSQLDPTKHAAFHLQLGRILAQNLSHETWEKHLFIVAHQLARGYKLISHRDERVVIAGRIFLRAGDKAAAASAFPEAKFFYARGIDMIDNDEDWESSYQLCMDCFSKGAEAAAIAGDYEQMDVWLRVAIRRSIGLDDQFRAHYIHVRSLAQRNEMEKAVDVGLEALELIGVRIPSDNVKLHTLIELFKTRRLMKRICVADLKKIEPNKEKQVVSASRLLNILSTLSLSGKKHLCPLICFKSVQFNIKHGILLGMPISLATYGFLLSRFGMLREATSYCEMANSVREDLGIVETIASVNMAIYGIVFPFSKPLGECEKQLHHGYTAGFEVGDVANSLRCASLHRYISFFSGQPLPKFLKGVDKISKLMKEYNSNSTLLVNLVYQQAAVNFSGSGGASPGPAYLNGDFCDYNKIEQQFQEKTHSILHEQMNLMQTILAYHFAHYDTGWKSSEKIRICGGGSTFKGFIFQYIHIFYRGLTAIALSRNENDNRKYAAVVKACVKDLKIGRKKSPLNLSHQSYLLEAELAVTKKRYAFAERLFLLSIEHAASAGILHEHALAHERFGFYYMMRNNHEAAYEQIRLARDLYAKWGSKAKIDFLSKKFPHLREKQRDHREMIELRRCST